MKAKSPTETQAAVSRIIPAIMSEMKKGPAYRIETKRLVLRCWEPRDAALLTDAITASLEHLRKWMPWANDEPTPLAAMTKRLRQFRALFDMDKDYVYAVFNQDETQVLGGSGLHTGLGETAREIGYWVHVDHINQGYATEASAALTEVAFEIDQMDRVEIHCSPKNLASASIPRKLGFVHEGTLRRRGPVRNGAPVDSMIWSMHADDYPVSLLVHEPIRAFDVSGNPLL